MARRGLEVSGTGTPGLHIQWTTPRLLPLPPLSTTVPIGQMPEGHRKVGPPQRARSQNCVMVCRSYNTRADRVTTGSLLREPARRLQSPLLQQHMGLAPHPAVAG
jgi:hypothetical protein